MKADLHLHTDASDGFLTRAQLLEFAAVKGIDCVSITDHDSIKNSYSDRNDPVKVIKGIEISTYNPLNDKNLHLLCYLPKDPEALQPVIRHAAEERNRVGALMVERVHELYPIVTMDRVLAHSARTGVIFKQHIMSVLIDYGYTNELYGELYRSLIGQNGSCGERPRHLPLADCLSYVKKARGVAVMAHPSIYDSVPLAGELAKEGCIDGLEVYHPRNHDEDIPAMQSICREYGLIETAGSDYHARNNSRNVTVGERTCGDDAVEGLYAVSDKK